MEAFAVITVILLFVHWFKPKQQTAYRSYTVYENRVEYD